MNWIILIISYFSKVSYDFHFFFLFSSFLKTFWLFAYISHPFSRTAKNDISLDASRKGEWHTLENFPFRSIFHRKKRGKWNIQNFTCTVSRIFHDGKWNGMENFLAYVTLFFKTRLTIYRSLLYVKIDARYKRRTKKT